MHRDTIIMKNEAKLLFGYFSGGEEPVLSGDLHNISEYFYGIIPRSIHCFCYAQVTSVRTNLILIATLA